MKRLIRHPAVQFGLARLLGWYLRFALATTRWRVDGQEHLAPLAAGLPHIVAFWHERLAPMAMLWTVCRRMPPRRAQVVHVLVSGHRDGLLITEVMRQFGMEAVQGSTSRGGAGGMRRLATILRNGGLVAITPDGPRGPPRIAAPGTARLSALSSAPVLPCAAQTSRRWIVGSWDRMVIPKPFGRGVLVCGPAIAVPRQRARDEEDATVIGAALSAAADRADLLCTA
jgi:lysophospholipid acyltransferase (LPLAT)-like uncharacterized protein